MSIHMGLNGDSARASRCVRTFHWSGVAPGRAPIARYVGDNFRCDLDAGHDGPHISAIWPEDRNGDASSGAARVTFRTARSGYRATVSWEPATYLES